MEIKIDDKYFIRVDERNYTLMEIYISEKDDTERKRVHGYFSSVESALVYLSRLKVVSSDSKMTIGKYIQTLKETTDKLVKAVGGV